MKDLKELVSQYIKENELDLIVVDALITNEKKQHYVHLSKPITQINGVAEPISGAKVVFSDKENIEVLIKAISSLPMPFDILVIDDNSPDGTGDIVKNMSKSFPNVHMIERPGKLGLGTAYITLKVVQLIRGWNDKSKIEA